jgi:hypothetical protein
MGHAASHVILRLCLSLPLFDRSNCALPSVRPYWSVRLLACPLP